ncbi:MAG: hypothetical protein SFY32_04160 [Bacteroidota bacterium]|nr:hypothetical protein [Bacteroidota bacterium]
MKNNIHNLIFSVLFSTFGFIFNSCSPSIEITRQFLKNKSELSMYNDHTKIIYKKFDNKNKSIIEISSIENGTTDKFLIISDTLRINDYSKTDQKLDSFIKYGLLNQNQLDSLYVQLKDWKRKIISKDRINAYQYHNYKINESFSIEFEFLNKLDQYYRTINNDSQISKDEDAYVPVFMEVMIIIKGRKHKLSSSDFNNIFNVIE